MFSFGELPAMCRHLNRKPGSVSATAVGGSPNSDKAGRLSMIRDVSIAGREAMARRLARSPVLLARSSTIGFSIGHAPATELLLEPSDVAEGSGSGNTLGLEQEDVTLNRIKFSRLNGEELALLQHPHHSALAGMKHMEAQPMQQHAEENSAQPLQLQPAASPPPHAALPPIAAAYFYNRLHAELPAHMPAHSPVTELDRLLSGGNPDTERCGRRKSKGALPRTRRTHGRQSKQVLPELREPLLWRPTSAYTPDTAEASQGDTPPSLPVQDLDSQPCDGMWRKLGSSLSAVWRWLCKSGCALKKLCKKVRRKLMTALGLEHDEAQALLAEQQSEEREVLPVRPVVPLQRVEQPQAPSRLQRWRM